MDFDAPALERNLSPGSICTLLWLFCPTKEFVIFIIRPPARLRMLGLLINLGVLELIDSEIRYEPVYSHMPQSPPGRFTVILSGFLTLLPR